MAQNAELAAQRAKDIGLLVLDVDGVLTDSGLYVDSRGEISKRFHAQDGLGIKAAQIAGIVVAVISGLDSPAVAARIKELGINEYHPGHYRKVPILKAIWEKTGIAPDRTAYIGDDWVDAGPMGLVGLPMAVADAQPEILDLALWVSARRGGHGAVREAIRFLLDASGRLATAYDWFLRDR